MPLVLRAIRTGRWAEAEQHYAWLLDGHILADPLADLTTTHGALSIFEIDDSKANLGRVVAALAVKRQRFDHFDYAIVEKEKLTEAGFRLSQTAGDTPDNMVNDLHFDVVELSVQRVAELALVLFHYSERERLNKKDVEALIRRNLQFLDANGIEKDMRQLLGL